MNEKDRIEKLLKSKNLSVTDLAKHLNEKNVQTVQNWFYRGGIPKTKLIKVADYFGVTTDYILRGK